MNALLEQYGAAFKTLEGVINKCPDNFWADEQTGPAFYKIVYHIMYFIDSYAASSQEERAAWKPRFDTAENFATSKENFHPREWEKPLTKQEILEYLEDLKVQWQQKMENLTIQDLVKESIFEWHGSSILASIIYNLRHIMVHAGALQVRLRKQGIQENYWVTKSPLVE